MRESKGKWKEAGAAKNLVPKRFINDQVPIVTVQHEAYILPQICKITKIYKLATIA